MRIPALIDTNVSFGTWPWMDFSSLTAQSLDAHLEREGIQEAWVSATESILFPDPDIPDARLLTALRSYSRMVPVKTINLLMVNWRESLHRAIAPPGMRLIKIYPNYHRYSLISPEARELGAWLAQAGLPLLIALRVEDERNQYPLMKVASVPVHEIVQEIAHDNARAVLLNTHSSAGCIRAGTDQVSLTYEIER